MGTLPHPSTIRDRAFFLVSVSEHRDTASFLPDRNAVSWHEPIQWNVSIVDDLVKCLYRECLTSG